MAGINAIGADWFADCAERLSNSCLRQSISKHFFIQFSSDGYLL
jgi:hypothetical protein